MMDPFADDAWLFSAHPRDAAWFSSIAQLLSGDHLWYMQSVISWSRRPAASAESSL
jgi:hypothetical protein